MLTRLRLQHFKGFNDFAVSFGESALLVGPNNAGKSTIIGALRLCGAASRAALRVRAPDGFEDGDRWVQGHPLSASMKGSGFVAENVRHEFREKPSRLDLTFSSKAVLHVVWPVESPPFFWVEHPKGMRVTTVAKAKTAVHRVGLTPTLTPVEYEEKRLSGEHIQANLETRLASRHFRNQLANVRDTDPDSYSQLIEFLLFWTPELTNLELVESFREGAAWLDLYYRDTGSRTEKEIYWAGDGVQIWLQVLFHVWRNAAAETLILDEPDVFLHPDLQRRLVRMLETKYGQTIMATHAPEVASEAHQGSVIWIERTRRYATRVTDDKTRGELTVVLGSGFSLSVARALRSRVALFVEGQDMKIIRILARTLGAERLAEERGLTVIPIGGFSHWPSVEAFSWLKAKLLGPAVDIRLLLDRDYRTDARCGELQALMGGSDVHVHVWRRKELESYLLEASAISRVTGLPQRHIETMLADQAEEMKSAVAGQYVRNALEAKTKEVDVATASQHAFEAFEAMWTVPGQSVRRVDAKAMISAINGELQAGGSPTISARKLARALHAYEIDAELAQTLLSIEDSLI